MTYRHCNKRTYIFCNKENCINQDEALELQTDKLIDAEFIMQGCKDFKEVKK